MADQLYPAFVPAGAEQAGAFSTPLGAFVRMLADAVNGTTGVVETRASYPSGLTIAGVASNASITVSAHTRQYASLAKPVQAGTVTGLTYGTTYYVYYDDLEAGGGLSPTPPQRRSRTPSPRPPIRPPLRRARHHARHRRGVQHNGHARLSAGVCAIRIERNPVFWRRWPPIRHAPRPYGLRRKRWDTWRACPSSCPLAAEHGGFFFTRLDALGLVMELHPLYPGRLGQEVLTAAKAACHVVFGAGCQVMTTMEMADNPRSQPPRSFGFKAAGEFQETALGRPASGRLPDLIGKHPQPLGGNHAARCNRGFLASAGGAAAIGAVGTVASAAMASSANKRR